ncbi:MAG: hypothetical protein CMO00_01315 [Synechococcus sp. SAT82]|nr:hypothetical protein [Synechococcus sp. SAT82]
MVLKSSESKAPAKLRFFVAITPLAGAMMFPIVVPIVINRFGISSGVLTALLLSGLWFIAMLKTSEMPH